MHAVAAPRRPDIEAGSSGQGRQDHKDSLNRYRCITSPDGDKDHFLNPENGKLELLRVQQAQGSSRPPDLEARTPWSGLESRNALQEAWKMIQRVPLAVLTWTYGNRLTAEAVRDGALASPSSPPVAEGTSSGKCNYLTVAFLTGGRIAALS